MAQHATAYLYRRANGDVLYLRIPSHEQHAVIVDQSGNRMWTHQYPNADIAHRQLEARQYTCDHQLTRSAELDLAPIGGYTRNPT